MQWRELALPQSRGYLVGAERSFLKEKMYVRSILGRSAIKACKVLIDPGTLYATVCDCDYLCCSVLMRILSK